jgi:hypothetical protein
MYYVHKTVVIAALTCSSETLASVKKQRRKRETADTRLHMNVARHILKDRIGIPVVRNELNIFNLNIIIQNCRLNWIHRADRMEAERIPKQVMGYTFRGTGSIGRPKLLWKDQPVIEARSESKIQILMLINVFLPKFHN